VVFGVDMKIVDDDGRELPHDGKAAGELLVRGPWIISSYFKGAGGDPLVRDTGTGTGWFPTGDVSTIDADGFMQITDRSKDVIKSGGEWIGSIDLENIAMAHPAVAMAACIAAHHPKWDERPLLVVMKKPNADVTARRAAAVLRRQDRQVVDAGRRGVRHQHPARRDRQDAEEQAARDVQGPSPAHRLSRRDDDTFDRAPGRRAAARSFRGFWPAWWWPRPPPSCRSTTGAPVMLFALLLGMAMNFLSGDGPCAGGIEFTAREVLRLGVALLGLRITIRPDRGTRLASGAAGRGVGGADDRSVDAGSPPAGLSGTLRPVDGRCHGDLRRIGRPGAGRRLAGHPQKERATLFTVVGVSALSTLAMIVYPMIAQAFGLDARRPGCSSAPPSTTWRRWSARATACRTRPATWPPSSS
jgi:hypothetical protein